MLQFYVTQVSVTLVQHFLVSNSFLETIACIQGQAQHLSYHQKRMDHALGKSDLFNLKELLKVPDTALLRCRILYNNSTIDISYHPYSKRNITTLQLVEDNEINYDYKYADRTQLDYNFSKRGSADDVLIVKNGYITDTTIANIAFYDGIQWFTPDTPLLEGTTRARLINEKQLIVSTIKVDDIRHFQGFALLNAMIGFHPIKNGIILPLKDL